MRNEGTSGDAGSADARRGARVLELIDRAPALDHEHHWEGEYFGHHGSASGSTVAVKARLAFHGEVIDGAGRLIDGLNDVLDGKYGFDVDATRVADVVELHLWFEAEVLARAPFVCTGLLTGDGREISGDWTVGCFDPDTCGCDGGGGTFRLKRID